MATTEELLIKLKADNTDLKNKLDQSKGQIQVFGNSFSALKMVGIGSFAALGAAALSFGKSAFAAYEQQEKANRRLLFALNGNTAAFKALTDQANNFQSKTGIADDAIQQIQTLAAQSGKGTDQIKKITEATINLSTATGQDLQSTYLQLNQTLTGSAGRLGRLDADFTNLSETQLKNGAAIDLVLTKYKGFAEESASSTDKLTASWDEFSETVGKSISGFILPLIDELNNSLNNMLNTISVKEFMNKTGVSSGFFSSNARDDAREILNIVKSAQDAESRSAAIRTLSSKAGFYSGDYGKEYNQMIAEGIKMLTSAQLENNKAVKSHTINVTDDKKAVDSWVESQKKALELAQYDVPERGMFLDVSSATGKGMPTVGAGTMMNTANRSAISKGLANTRMTARDIESPLAGAVELTNKQLNEQIGLVNDLSSAFLDMAASGEMSMQSLSMTVLAAIRKIITAKLAEAIASQIASGSSKGLPGLALAAIGISAVMGMFSKIPKFETGGIVGGSSFRGDTITARVNSGEMILNASQQAQLFAMANGAGGGGTLVTKISANDLYIMMKRGEYLSGRNGRR